MASENPYIQALQWHIDQGIEFVLEDEAFSFYKEPSAEPTLQPQANHAQSAQDHYADMAPPHGNAPSQAIDYSNILPKSTPSTSTNPMPSQNLDEAIEIAKSAQSLEELKEKIAQFEGLSIKRMATNLVFADGHQNARIMVIGDAPGADEDRQGSPMAGASGILFDKIFASIGLSRTSENPDNSLYVSNILNWRPPGGRTPDTQELAMSLPFIERHIALKNPDIIIVAGDTPLKTLLKSKKGIMKLRGQWLEYTPQTLGIAEGTKAEARTPIPVLPILHPDYIMKNPTEKHKMWLEMIDLKEKIKTI